VACGAGHRAAEWWEDLWQAGTGSRVVLVCVPAGWGRSTVLDRFQAEVADRDDAPVT
jgi:ATP/maltotriose-dependent transcriptional regulator MalT